MDYQVHACDNETLEKRLQGAYAKLEPLIRADFPEPLRQRYANILSRLTKKGSVEATTAAMSIGERYEIAALIVGLFFAVESAANALPLSRHLPPVGGHSSQ